MSDRIWGFSSRVQSVKLFAFPCKKSRVLQNVQIGKLICVVYNWILSLYIYKQFTKLSKWKTQNPDDFNPHYYCICYCYCNWKSREDAAIYPAHNGLKSIMKEYPYFQVLRIGLLNSYQQAIVLKWYNKNTFLVKSLLFDFFLVSA